MLAIDPDPERALARHVLSQAFVLALQGIPLLYTHVLLASENDVDGYRRSAVARDLNRADISVADLDRQLADADSRASRALAAIREMLRRRSSSDAFHPDAAQTVSRSGPVVIVERRGVSGAVARVLLNVSTRDAEFESILSPRPAARSGWCERFRAIGPGSLTPLARVLVAGRGAR